jgi:hypothetical protein
LRRLPFLPLIAISLTLVPGSAHAAQATKARAAKHVSSTLSPGQRLTTRQSRLSSNRRFELTMRPSGNLVLRERKSNNTLWTSQTADSPGAYAAMQRDGNLVVRSKAGQALFATATSAYAGSKLTVQGNGTAVVRSRDSHAVWDSKSDIWQLRPGQALRPGQSRRSLAGHRWLAMAKDGNLLLFERPGDKVVWQSQTGRNPGASAVMAPDGNLIVRSAQGKTLYASGTQGNPGANLRLQADGNVVIVSSAVVPLWSAGADIHQLSAGQKLLPKQWRQSLNGQFMLAMEDDGNLLLLDLRNGWERRTIAWSTGTAGHPGAYAAMQLDGNFVVRGTDGATLFNTGTTSHPPGNLKVLGDGNVVLYSGCDEVQWTRAGLLKRTGCAG